MIYLKEVKSAKDRKIFFRFPETVYYGNPYYRSTTEDIARMLVSEKSVFFEHAKIKSFLITDGINVRGRFSLIKDDKLPEYVQVAFFEAAWGLSGLLDAIKLKVKVVFPEVTKIVAGLSGHLNYEAGFLVDRFDEPPVFGLPYTPPYYSEYFKDLTPRSMVSFRFDHRGFFKLTENIKLSEFAPGITVRHMDSSKLRDETDRYTYLNNMCFGEHPYWADRTADEDFELFHPFRFLMKEENLIFAEDNGKPVGFLLWYPDFNQLVASGENLGLKHVVSYKLLNPIDTVRLTEIAVLPEYRNKGVVEAMLMSMIESCKKAGYRYTEGGFIFEENKVSIGMTQKLIQYVYGKPLPPYRKYVVFDGVL